MLFMKPAMANLPKSISFAGLAMILLLPFLHMCYGATFSAKSYRDIRVYINSETMLSGPGPSLTVEVKNQANRTVKNTFNLRKVKESGYKDLQLFGGQIPLTIEKIVVTKWNLNKFLEINNPNGNWIIEKILTEKFMIILGLSEVINNYETIYYEAALLPTEFSTTSDTYSASGAAMASRPTGYKIKREFRIGKEFDYPAKAPLWNRFLKGGKEEQSP